MVEPYYQDQHATIYHGDCLIILPQFGLVDLVLTDPPYGTGCSPRGGSKAGTIDMDSAPSLSWDEWDTSWIDLLPGVPIASFCHNSKIGELGHRMGADGALYYVKSNPLPFGCSVEPCLTRGYSRRGRNHIVSYNARNGQGHPTEKPLEVILFILGKAPAGTVLDPFMGSGTTLVAAKELGRKAVGIEKSREYCDLAVKRLRQGVLF